MKKVCAWCRNEMGFTDPADDLLSPITHGMCDGCYGKILADYARSLRQLLDKLDIPVLMVDAEGIVATANQPARDLVGKSLPDIEGRKGGDILNCVHSYHVGGCGNTPYCKNCTIRNTVLETFASGLSLSNVPASLDVTTPQGVKQTDFLVTTEKINDCVLLRLEKLESAPAAQSPS